MKLFVAVLLLCGVHVVFSCTCFLPLGHPQVLFCSSDIVIIGKIVKVTVPEEQNENIIYVVKVKRTFKGDVEDKIIVTTINSVGVCGITHLKKGQTYVLTAKSEDDGRYSIALCRSLVVEQKDITRKLKKLLDSNRSKSYPSKDGINCEKCKIQYCGLNGNCGIIAPPPTTCTYFGDITKIKCYNKLRCIPIASGNSCRWSAFNCGGPGGFNNG